MRCIWEPFEDKCRCKNCGFIVPDDSWIKNCDKFKDKTLTEKSKVNKDLNRTPPPLPKRLKNFGKAAISHWLNGNPTCSDEEIQARLEICEGCLLFKRYDEESGVCTHQDCGCNIKSLNKYLNKLAWADQSCPIGKWGPINKNGV